MTLRQASADDLDQLQDLETRAFGENAWSANSLLKNTVWLAELNGLIVGAIVFRVLGQVECELLSIAVHPDQRRQGLARRLMEQLPNLPTFLEVRESNSAARSLYLQSGFVESGRRKRYYQNPTEDAVVMMRTESAQPVMLQS